MTPQDFDTLVRNRRSVRGFLPRPVPDTVIDAAFESALWAPSNCNVQPWSVHLVSGERLRDLGRALTARAASRSCRDASDEGARVSPETGVRPTRTSTIEARSMRM